MDKQRKKPKLMLLILVFAMIGSFLLGAEETVNADALQNGTSIAVSELNISRAGDVFINMKNTQDDKLWKLTVGDSGSTFSIISPQGTATFKGDNNQGSAILPNLQTYSSYGGAVSTTIKGSSGQTANILEVKNSDDTVLVSVNSNGDIKAIKSIILGECDANTPEGGLCYNSTSKKFYGKNNTGLIALA